MLRAYGYEDSRKEFCEEGILPAAGVFVPDYYERRIILRNLSLFYLLLLECCAFPLTFICGSHVFIHYS